MEAAVKKLREVDKAAGYTPFNEEDFAHSEAEENQVSYRDADDFLAHYGVKGMHWGVRRQARRDANEYTKAKLAYGKGAGTRRKLINAKVQQRSENSDYKSAFDEFVTGQNLSRRARQAKVSSRSKAAVRSTTKTARGVHRSITGGFGSVSLASAAVAGAYLYARQTGADKIIMNKAADFIRNNRSQEATKAWLRSQGVQGI